MARWGELQLQAEDGAARCICVAAADPAGVNMDRVVAGMRASAHALPAPAWLFTLAAGAGATALAVIFPA
jgi:hypothetical protein